MFACNGSNNFDNAQSSNKAVVWIDNSENSNEILQLTTQMVWIQSNQINLCVWVKLAIQPSISSFVN